MCSIRISFGTNVKTKNYVVCIHPNCISQFVQCHQYTTKGAVVICRLSKLHQSIYAGFQYTVNILITYFQQNKERTKKKSKLNLLYILTDSQYEINQAATSGNGIAQRTSVSACRILTTKVIYYIDFFERKINAFVNDHRQRQSNINQAIFA